MAQDLPTTVLGRTRLQVTRLGYGAMEVRGSRIWGGRPVTDEQERGNEHAMPKLWVRKP